MRTNQTRWSLGHGKPLVPSRWQATVLCDREHANVQVSNIEPSPGGLAVGSRRFRFARGETGIFASAACAECE